MSARTELLELIIKNPEIHYREISRLSSYSATNVRHHLGQLVKRGDVKEVKEGKNIRYYPVSFNVEETKLMGLLRQRSVRRILLLISTKKCTNKELISRLKLSPSTISFHTKKLLDGNIIEKKFYYALLIDKVHLVKLIKEYKETFFDSLVDNMTELW